MANESEIEEVVLKAESALPLEKDGLASLARGALILTNKRLVFAEPKTSRGEVIAALAVLATGLAGGIVYQELAKKWASVRDLDEMKAAMAQANSFELPLEHITELELDKVTWGFSLSKLVVRWKTPSGLSQAALSIMGTTHGQVNRRLDEWAKAIGDASGAGIVSPVYLAKKAWQTSEISPESKKFMKQCSKCGNWSPKASEKCGACGGEFNPN